MPGRFALDTNIVIAMFREDESVFAQLDDSVEIFLPLTIVGELYHGAEKSANRQQNYDRIEALLLDFPILIYNQSVAIQYGKIKRHVEAKGKPIPENDLWIAACAQYFDLTLATRDLHFANIDGLRTVRW